MKIPKCLFLILCLLISVSIFIVPITVYAYNSNDRIISMPTANGYQYYAINGNNDDSKDNDYIETVGYKGDKNTTSLSIPESIMYTYSDGTKKDLPVKKIGYDTFRDFDRIETVKFPSKLDEIGYGAFHGCTALKSVTIPNTVLTIGDFAFSDCKSLSSINFGTSVKTIGVFAFAECDSLITIKLPNSVTEIKDNAFAQCDNLTNVDLGSGQKKIGWQIFDCSPKVKNITNNKSSVKLSTGNISVIERINGDANLDGKLNISDASLTQKYLAKISNTVSLQADFNGDGDVDIRDTTAIQRKIAKLQ